MIRPEDVLCNFLSFDPKRRLGQSLGAVFPFTMFEVRNPQFMIQKIPGCVSSTADGVGRLLAVILLLLLGAGRLMAQGTEDAPDLSPPPLPAGEVPAPTPLPRVENLPLPESRPVVLSTPAPKRGGPSVVFAHPGGAVANYGREGSRRAALLRSHAPRNYSFDRAALRDVLRLLAEEADIPYIGIPEHSPKAQRLVTLKMTASPFAALENLMRQNDIKFDYEDGVWFMRVRDANIERAYTAEHENELVSVIYQLKYDPVDRVDFRENTGGMGGGGGGTGTTTTAGAAQITTPNMPLQYSQRVFQAKAPRVVNEIRSMLGMRPLQYNADGTVTDLDAEGQISSAAQRVPLLPSDGEGASISAAGAPAGGAAATQAGQAPVAGAQGSNLLPVYVPPQRPQVIYNSDSNLLWVVATRKQHKWVGEYLARVDKPQDLIAIEVKFFETRKNPQTDFGINWENTFGSGITVRGGARVGAGTAENPGEIGNITYNSMSGTEPEGTPGISVPVDYQNRGLTLNAPYSAVLSMDQVSATVQAFVRDRDSSLVQYPRVLTINNREVAITAAENTPVNAGVSQTQSGSTATQTGTLGYLPTGTQINILPKSVGKGQIALTVAITISQIVRFEQINLGTGMNPYPVTTQRVYNAALQVDSGYTLAVGGLEKTADSKNTGGVPLLKDIPAVGYLFKNKNRSRDRSNLIIFITPYLISDPSRTPGISEHPEAVIPIRPGVPPPAPNFTPDGGLLGGDAAIPQALDWLEFQMRYFNQTNLEGRADRRSMSELRGVIGRARELARLLQDEIAAGKGYASAGLVDFSTRADELLVGLNKALAKAQLDQFQMGQGIP